MAKYGIDRAMLAESGKEADPVVDTVIFAERPYAKPMMELLYRIASVLGAECRAVKQWDPEDHGGRSKGAWHYGLRLFIHESDLLRVRMLYASLRNQAAAGASRITGSAEYGQDQRAYRINYLDGFSSAIYYRLEQAEREAREAREAEQQELADKAMLTGANAGRSVELVLADRRVAVRNTMTLAVYGKTAAELDAGMAANRERWAEMDRRAQERHEARVKAHQECGRCHAAKSGYCTDHRDLRPSQATSRYRESVGAEYRYEGYRDGQNADLGTTAPQVGGDRKKALS